MKVLIIEDNAEVAEAVSLCLQVRWPDVEIAVAADGTKAVEQARTGAFDIAILDLGLPDIDGMEVISQIRSTSTIPIVVLTVRGKEEDKIKGLELGADDYITKPFRPGDLVARINAVLRRTKITGIAEEQPIFTRGKLSLNLITDEVTLRNRTTKLTPTELKLLHSLMKDAEQTVQMSKILETVWGKGCTDEEIVRTYIRRLRDSLQDDPPQIILTDRKAGYRFITPH